MRALGAMSPDGKKFAFAASTSKPVLSYTQPDLWVLDIAAKAQPKNLTTGLDFDVASGICGGTAPARGGGWGGVRGVGGQVGDCPVEGTWAGRLKLWAVLFFLYVGYLILRAFVDDPDRGAQWSAAVGLLGALNVPIVYMSVRWWRTLHQPQSSPRTLDPNFTLGLRINAIAVMIILIWFIKHRYDTAKMERAADQMHERPALSGRGGINA